jgi:hypothetical protein
MFQSQKNALTHTSQDRCRLQIHFLVTAGQIEAPIDSPLLLLHLLAILSHGRSGTTLLVTAFDIST